MSSLEAANLFNVKDLVAVITGGGTGIGLMMAKALALNGARKVVIAISSIAAFNSRATIGYAYGQSKAATTLLMKHMTTSLVPYRIRANVIAPGLFPSELSASVVGDGIFAKEKIPAERLGATEEMAGSILYLTSRAGAYCNGSVVVVDGGRLSLMPATY